MKRVIQKSHKEQIRIEDKLYQGETFVDVRMYYKNNGAGWQPSDKGISVPLKDAAEIQQALTEVLKAIPIGGIR